MLQYYIFVMTIAAVSRPRAPVRPRPSRGRLKNLREIDSVSPKFFASGGAPQAGEANRAPQAGGANHVSA